MNFIKAKAIAVTQPVVDFIPDSEGIISYSARVSNPDNQTNFETANKLLSYCAKHGHWSVFETASVVMEVQVPRDIARQLLRHRSFSFQEFSQRYSQAQEFVIRDARMQDYKNRQNSIESVPEDTSSWWYNEQSSLLAKIEEVYQEALEKGIAKECARVILPEGNTMSYLYMNGTVRSYMHYCQLRRHEATQKEHRILADEIAKQMAEYFPSLAEHFEAN